MKKHIFLLMIALFAVLPLGAQQLYIPRNVAKAYQNGTRSADGRPGPKYWQNKASYNIRVSASPPNRTVSGSEDIVYTNNSPDTLKTVVIRLELNSHAPEAPRENTVNSNYLTSGVTIDEYSENGKVKAWGRSKGRTWVQIPLDTPVTPGGKVTFTFKWHYDASTETNREGAIDPTTFFLAYFYPRVAVYDDTGGWDRIDFTEGHEFYNDFNDYTFEVTVPKNFVVWATGDLLNGDQTLKPEYAARLKKSFTSDDVIHVATLDELKANSVTAQTNTVTWKWKADNVSDVAAALSDHFIWDAGSVVVDKKTNRRASVQSAYNVEAVDFQKMVEYGKHSLDWCSNNFPGVPYPFQKTTIVRGFADMEYPMMVNDSSQRDPRFTRFIVEHEILHSWFPFYMGINEQRYGFMDEGWTTAFEYLIGTDDLGVETATNFFKGFRVEHWIMDPGADADIPIMTPGDAMFGPGFADNEYGKAALAYLALKDLLGDELFKSSLHEFIATWNGRHTLPWDMFNSFNRASGKDLNWFFNNWYFSTGYIDLAVANVSGDQVTIRNVGGMAAPVDVVVIFDDASTQRIHQTPAIWQANPREAKVTIPSTKPIKSVTLDGGIWMDANEADNMWKSQ